MINYSNFINKGKSHKIEYCQNIRKGKLERKRKSFWYTQIRYFSMRTVTYKGAFGVQSFYHLACRKL